MRDCSCCCYCPDDGKGGECGAGREGRGVNICVCTRSYVLYMKGSATEMGWAEEREEEEEGRLILLG